MRQIVNPGCRRTFVPCGLLSDLYGDKKGRKEVSEAISLRGRPFRQGGRVGQPTSASCSFDPDLQRSLRHGFPPLFATGFIQDTDPVFSVFHPARTLKHGTRLPLLPFFRFTNPIASVRHEFSRHGGQQKARSHCPQPIRSITPSRFPWSST